jgi:hypothetical protein
VRVETIATYLFRCHCGIGDEGREEGNAGDTVSYMRRFVSFHRERMQGMFAGGCTKKRYVVVLRDRPGASPIESYVRRFAYMTPGVLHGCVNV